MPLGAMEESEERWGKEVGAAWRLALNRAVDATDLMECQVLLEYGVRTSWLHPAGAKLLTCMPSRIHCLRHATYGLVAMRMWALDQAVRFDKVQYPDANETKSKGGSKGSHKKGGSTSGKSSIGKKKK
eukprot:CAMPEP_0182438986 /NCGR_PEP_ID=MMETSP1167-20130531/86151_1 /TAXON_ID=2988 /ORGANISM="Mallomonas Sp, Strain CCMP3275" /LENGTH=127 /DNA_ID=CAMNT_0024632565 /DNA_START=774 /DNA_END=1157 /DNA_ORIENTATION=-